MAISADVIPNPPITLPPSESTCVANWIPITSEIVARNIVEIL